MEHEEIINNNTLTSCVVLLFADIFVFRETFVLYLALIVCIRHLKSANGSYSNLIISNFIYRCYSTSCYSIPSKSFPLPHVFLTLITHFQHICTVYSNTCTYRFLKFRFPLYRLT